VGILLGNICVSYTLLLFSDRVFWCFTKDYAEFLFQWLLRIPKNKKCWNTEKCYFRQYDVLFREMSHGDFVETEIYCYFFCQHRVNEVFLLCKRVTLNDIWCYQDDHTHTCINTSRISGILVLIKIKIERLVIKKLQYKYAIFLTNYMKFLRIIQIFYLEQIIWSRVILRHYKSISKVNWMCNSKCFFNLKLSTSSHDFTHMNENENTTAILRSILKMN
jgi:hypothetical protein